MKTGDRVVCIDDSGKSSRLTKGKEYIIHNTSNCSCGQKIIDVGISNPFNVKCYCGECVSFKGGVDWCSPKRFRKVEEKVNYVKLEIEVEEPCLN